MLRQRKLTITGVACMAATTFLALPSAALDLAQNGKPVASIVIPVQPLPVESYAAKELQYHVEASTGARLAIVSEDEDIPSGAHVYLGNCKAAKAAGADPSDLPGNGYVVRTVGEDLYIAGKDSPGDPLGMNTHAGTLFGVYDLLENNMGVRWLWPGKLGEVIPAQKDLTLPSLSASVRPLLWFKEWRTGLENQCGGELVGTLADYSSEAKYQHYIQDENQWLRRQRFGRSVQLSYGHAFSDWWEKYGTTHPEYFRMLPNGKRGTESTDRDDFQYISMCVSQPALWKKMVEDWKARGAPEFINVCENDGWAGCACPNCMAWDVPDPTDGIDFNTRLEAAKKVHAGQDGNPELWMLKLGSLSDRYAKYAEAVRTEAAKLRPDVKAVMYVYDNYRKPPVSTKLNPNVLCGEVPPGIFPYNRKESDLFRKDWEGWAKTGCSLFLRPNYTLQGHNLPVFYARTVGEDLKFAMRNSMKGADFDSLTGQYATQGPSLYVLAKMLNHPEASVEGVIDEYCAAFGPARDAVKEYFNYWESVSGRDDVPNADTRFLRQVATKIYTPEVMRNAWAIMQRARKAAAGDELAATRVEWLAKGLQHADLTLIAQRTFEASRQSGDNTELNKAWQALKDFRRQNEDLGLANYSGLTSMETQAWSGSRRER
jgi:hypothetical protein